MTCEPVGNILRAHEPANMRACMSACPRTLRACHLTNACTVCSSRSHSYTHIISRLLLNVKVLLCLRTCTTVTSCVHVCCVSPHSACTNTRHIAPLVHILLLSSHLLLLAVCLACLQSCHVVAPSIVSCHMALIHAFFGLFKAFPFLSSSISPNFFSSSFSRD